MPMLSMLATQPGAKFVLQPLDDLVANCGSFGIRHGSIRLIGQAIGKRLLSCSDLLPAIDIE